MSLQWRELDKKLSTAESSDGMDVYVEEVDRPATGELFYEASVMDHSSGDHGPQLMLRKRFTSREDAIRYLESVVAN
jgi:hypothetical protein